RRRGAGGRGLRGRWPTGGPSPGRVPCGPPAPRGCRGRPRARRARRPPCRARPRPIPCVPRPEILVSYGEIVKEHRMSQPRTLSEKVWDRHVVHAAPDQPDLLYIDLHLIHEVTSPQAFDGLRLAGRSVRRPALTIATEDHNVPTADIDQPIADEISAKQVDTLRRNAAEFGVTNFPMGDP